MNVDGTAIDLLVNRQTGEISIVNWSDVIKPTWTFDLQKTVASKPDETLQRYCDTLAAIFKTPASQAGANTPSKIGQSLRKMTRVKARLVFFPEALAGQNLVSKVSSEFSSTNPPLPDGLTIENSLTIGRVQVKVIWADDAIARFAGVDGVEPAIDKLINASTADISRTGQVEVDEIGDDVSCDLATARAKVSITIDGRYADKESRSSFLTARDAARILSFVDDGNKGLQSTDSYLTVRRTALLVDAYHAAKRQPTSELGIEKLVTLYRMVFEPDKVTGFVEAVSRFGRNRAISRGLDNVTSTARPAQFDGRLVSVKGGN